jgi:hypothetical protein
VCACQDRQQCGELYSAGVARRIVGRVLFYAARVVSKESLWVVYRPVVARQRLGKHVPAAKLRIVGGVVFYAARVVSKESRRDYVAWDDKMIDEC